MTSTFETIANTAVLVLLAVFVAYILWLLVGRMTADLKSQRDGPITFTPVIPFPQGNLRVFKGTQKFKNIAPDAKIQVDENTDREEDGLLSDFGLKYYVYKRINEFVALTFKLHSRLPDEYEVGKSWTNRKSYKLKPKISVPRTARTVSIKMDGYEHGEKCHDFVPIGGAARGSHYTYQMFGDNRIQVTKYVVDGRSEVAGFCIYIENPWLSQAEYRWHLLKDMARSVKITENLQLTDGKENEVSQKTDELNPEDNTKLISMEWTVKYCSKLKRKVMTSMDSDEDVVHQEWIHNSHLMRIEKCEECTKEGLEKEEQPPTYSSVFIT